MRRILVSLGLGVALAFGGGVATADAAWKPSQGRVPDGQCVYQVRQNTLLYENTKWHRHKRGNTFFDRISKGSYVAGHCFSSGGWKQIKYVNFNHNWGPVRYFQGDRDFMRTSTLKYVGRY